MSTFKTIGTHSGAFHCDEALAIYMLKTLPEFKDGVVTRSRDMEVLKTLDILVDVGSEYDPATLRFDHHQRSFAETFSPKHTIRLSSAGLIYKHFGRRIVTEQSGLEDDDQIEAVYNELYNSFIEAMDALDNGVPQYASTEAPRYRDSTSLGSRVARLNPDWNEKFTDEQLMQHFETAIEYCGKEFQDSLRSLVKSWLPARQIVIDAIHARFSHHPSGRIIALDTFAPWKNHFFTMQADEESSNGSSSLSDVAYVIYESAGQWRYLNVPIFPSSFESRMNVPKEWCGLRDAELDAVTGIPGGTFIHHSGFTGGHQTREGLMQMLEISLKQYEKQDQIEGKDATESKDAKRIRVE